MSDIKHLFIATQFMINQGTYQQIPGVINEDNARASVVLLLIKTVVIIVVISVLECVRTCDTRVHFR